MCELRTLVADADRLAGPGSDGKPLLAEIRNRIFEARRMLEWAKDTARLAEARRIVPELAGILGDADPRTIWFRGKLSRMEDRSGHPEKAKLLLVEKQWPGPQRATATQMPRQPTFAVNCTRSRAN